MQKSNDSKNIAIVYVKKSVYRIYFLDMNKREAKKLMINSNLIDKIGILWMVINKKILWSEWEWEWEWEREWEWEWE